MGCLEFLHVDMKHWVFSSLSVQESWLNVEMTSERTKWTLSENGLLVQICPSTLTLYSLVAVTFQHRNLVIEAMLMQLSVEKDDTMASF